MFYPDLDGFKELARRGNLVPVFAEILADTETPVSALMRFRHKPRVFLLESVEGGEKWGRYTFLGLDARVVVRVKGDEVQVEEHGAVRIHKHLGNPLETLKALLARYRPVAVDSLPRFYGGAVGFLGYDMVRFFERLPEPGTDEMGTDDAAFLLTDTLLIFDNVKQTIKVVACAFTEGEDALEEVYDRATEKIRELVGMLQEARPTNSETAPAANSCTFQANMAPERFKSMVERAREYIHAGDVIQVVLSQRFEGETRADPLDLYRALRFINPSPYLFFLKMDRTTLIGSSPEVMVRVEDGVVELRPIAGTRPRGEDEQTDRLLADELLEDPKERAEHVMLVDLGRNDLGRIARIGSVQVTQLMAVERYSHVMHLVSHIQAQLSPGKDAFDVLKATFPAGTLSGAPKVRAMEIIGELEPCRRGPYGGAVGYIGYSGNMDFCITIRTAVMQDRGISIQAGAGIVADSDPEAEYRETLSKAMGMMQAVRVAESGLAISTPSARGKWSGAPEMSQERVAMKE